MVSPPPTKSLFTSLPSPLLRVIGGLQCGGGETVNMEKYRNVFQPGLYFNTLCRCVPQRAIQLRSVGESMQIGLSGGGDTSYGSNH